MKITMMFKDPDCIYEAKRDAVKANHEERVKALGLSMGESEALLAASEEAVDEIVSEWTMYGDYAGIEIDTEARTARVLTHAELNKL
jgi:hypothetical protein